MSAPLAVYCTLNFVFYSLQKLKKKKKIEVYKQRNWNKFEIIWDTETMCFSFHLQISSIYRIIRTIEDISSILYRLAEVSSSERIKLSFYLRYFRAYIYT